MTKSKAGRPGTIQSEYPLERISTRISVEAIEILNKQNNKAMFIDEAIKAKACEHEFAICDKNGSFQLTGEPMRDPGYAKCTKCGFMA